MSKFWDWYDGLAKNDGNLRFLIFLCLILFMYIVIPLVVGFIYGHQYTTVATVGSLMIMTLLALSKHFRWPK
jgi:hypothetical protein